MRTRAMDKTLFGVSVPGLGKVSKTIHALLQSRQVYLHAD
jgi:hypothetical protein